MVLNKSVHKSEYSNHGGKQSIEEIKIVSVISGSLGGEYKVSLPGCSAMIIILMMEIVRTSETSVNST
jgi:hypothetical protein